MIRIAHADMLEAIPRLVAEGTVCDACVTDPPYHLVNAAERTKYAVRCGPIARMTTGFMGTTWDGGDIAFRPDTWATLATILRPGAFLVAFGGTRTYHRLASAIEDAGFVIQDTIAWLYGTGFPKRRDMLKPAFEPIVLAYKPGGKRTMGVDECRVGTQSTARNNHTQGFWSSDGGDFNTGSDAGRWPANVCHDGSDEVLAAFPQSDSGPPRIPSGSRERQSDFALHDGSGGYGDTGSAARFFFSAKAGAEDRWGSRHPTIKPVELIRWLVKLTVPPDGTFLDPFAGSGTAAVAALAEGRNAILIEREPQYIADIRERIAFYEGAAAHSVQAKGRNRKQDHGPLFAEPFDEAADAIGSYNEAIRAIGERVKAGEPVPPFLLPLEG